MPLPQLTAVQIIMRLLLMLWRLERCPQLTEVQRMKLLVVLVVLWRSFGWALERCRAPRQKGCAPPCAKNNVAATSSGPTDLGCSRKK